jgi:glycerate-2-kinase
VYISDVNSGDVRSIASNPLLSEGPVRERALAVVRRFRLTGMLPRAVLKELYSGDRRSEDASPGREAPGTILGTVLLCDNSIAVEAAGRVAAGLGFHTYTYADLVEGDYRAVAEEMIARLWELRSRLPAEPLCLITGGEVSCVVTGNGVGGRNQQFVLYSAAKLAEQCVGTGPVAVLSCGTDGIDGNSPAAGAVSDRQCIEEAVRNGIDPGLYLRENNSFSFFSKMGGLVLTGATGTNVRDIRIILSAPAG